MGAKFPGTKPLPDSFGSLGTPGTSTPAESSKPTQKTSLFTVVSTPDVQLPSSTSQSSANAPTNVFANLAEKDSQQSKDPPQTTQSASLASSQALLKPFSFPKLGEPPNIVSAAPSSSTPTPTPSLGFTLGQSASLASSQAPLKPFSFPKLREPSSIESAAPSSTPTPTPPLGFTLGQSGSLASSQAPLKPFSFPKLGEASSIVSAAPSSMPTPTPSLGFTLGQPGKSENSDTKSEAFIPLFSQAKQTSSAPTAQTNATNSQSFGSSIFTQPSLHQSNQTLQSQEETLRPNLGVGRASQPVYFDNLLEKGKKANALYGDSGFGDLPSLQLGLGEIARKARELGGVGAQMNGGTMVDSKAHYLLAASGVNPGTTRRDLDSLHAQSFGASNRQLNTHWDPDINKFVAQLQQQSTLKMIAEGVERAHRNFNIFLDENVDMNWELQRRKIYQHFGLVSRDSADGGNYSSADGKGSFGRSSKRARPSNPVKLDQSTLNKSFFLNPSLQKSVIGTPGIGTPNSNLFADVAEKADTTIKSQDDRFTRSKQAKFAQIVHILNEARLQETNFPLLEEFSSLDQEPGGESPNRLKDAYDALIEIVQDNSSGGSGGSKPTKERQFAESYLDENPNSMGSVTIRKRIINGSRRCLEKQFFQLLSDLVDRNPREANIGGKPTTINKVRAYVRIRAARKDLVADGIQLQTLEDDFCWALIFFCLRSGLLNEAAEYVTCNAVAFRALDRNFITYITSYASSPDRRLTRAMQDRINAEFQQRNRIAPENSLDPYRMACYKIVGRCELGKRLFENINQGIEDWMWLQFSLARESNRVEEVAGEVFGLNEVRVTIREIGQRFFSKGQDEIGGYGTYFFLQVLGGMFEQAVSYLYPYSYVSAVHFAIALDFYGLLRVSDVSISENELLTHTTRDSPQISFSRMLGYYTRDFRAGNVDAAVDYLALICLNADLPGALGKSQASLCHEALRELVLETREFAQLLGDIRSDGTRLKGAIEKRLKLIHLAGQGEFLQTVTVQAASIADDNGRTADAVLLYHLAEDYDNVIAIINHALSEAIAVEIGQEEMRLQPLKPRTSNPLAQNQQQQGSLPGSSLSLVSVDDPAGLAGNMITVYQSNALYYEKISPVNRDACGILLQLSSAKSKVLQGKWAEALDLIDGLNLLPLHAKSSIPAIRSHAQAFNALPQSLSRNIGPLLLWTITCIGHQREILAAGQFGGNSNQTRKEIREDLLSAAKDLMIFAGLIKYRLGERVWEAITKCGGDVGAYS